MGYIISKNFCIANVSKGLQDRSYQYIYANNRVLNSTATSRRLPFIYLIIVLVLILGLVGLGATYMLSQNDAYTQSVLKLEGDSTKGRSIFVMNCVACHGQWADGKVGPSLKNVSERLSKPKLIRQVVSGNTPPMPQFQPTSQEMADLLSYLKQL